MIYNFAYNLKLSIMKKTGIVLMLLLLNLIAVAQDAERPDMDLQNSAEAMSANDDEKLTIGGLCPD